MVRTRWGWWLGLIALAWMIGASANDADAEVVEARARPIRLAAAAPFVPKDHVVAVEISEYAGYAGLLVANGGLEPNPDSVFAKEFGFQLKLTVSEAESWSALNAGRIAAAPSTVDVLAVYGDQLRVKVPVLIGYSRGADGVVVRRGIRGVNGLKGQRLATCQFTEADFFIRYLAQEASLPVRTLSGPDAPADPKALNLVYTADAFAAGDLFARDLKEGRDRLAGCVTWDPKTGEVVDGSEDKAHLLATNRNVLIVADILMVNAGFAESHPQWVAGLARGVLKGNATVRANPEAAFAVLEKAFGWSAEDAREELQKVHLANVPENKAFFDDEIAAGGYGYIFDTALDVYGVEAAARTADLGTFVWPQGLGEAEKDAAFAGETADIGVLGEGVTIHAEAPALLSKNLFFYFVANEANLSPGREAENDMQLLTIRRWLQVGPGSKVLLRGHADGSMLPTIEKDEGAAKAREARVALKNLSRRRSVAIRRLLIDRFQIPVERVESFAVGVDEPTGEGPDADRRVEAQWFTAK